MPLRRWLFICQSSLLLSQRCAPGPTARLSRHQALRGRARARSGRPHDAGGKGRTSSKTGRTAIPRLGIPDYQTWNEALHGVARAGYATVFPQAIGMAATWDPAMVHAMGDVISERGARQVQPGAARRQSPHLLRPDLLVAQHQHLSRSALGPRPGDLRRRPVPDRPHGRRFHRRRAGPRSRIICAPSPPASTSRCIPGPSRCATDSMSIPARAIWKRPICPRFAPP